MKPTKFTALALSFVALFACLAGCGKTPDTVSDGADSVQKAYKDGEYRASSVGYDSDGYKDTVEIVIKDGVLLSVDCNSEHKDGGTKKSLSESGKYDMKAAGAMHEWHEEIALFEQFVATNGIEAVTLDKSGKTDAVTGCTISVKKYKELIAEALKKAET